MPGEWSDWMGLAQAADELEADRRSVARTAERQGTLHGFEVEQREASRATSGRRRWEYRYRYVAEEEEAAE